MLPGQVITGEVQVGNETSMELPEDDVFDVAPLEIVILAVYAALGVPTGTVRIIVSDKAAPWEIFLVRVVTVVEL